MRFLPAGLSWLGQDPTEGRSHLGRAVTLRDGIVKSVGETKIRLNALLNDFWLSQQQLFKID
ncbi:MAG TPA: hypothetical protein PLN31_08255 [Azoarcus taiwanensis]|nr:hypothetical protein [Azoarcus taiwanensis]